MAAIFVAATRQHVGKTSSCLGIVNGMKQRLPGGGCGFIKPVGQRHVPVGTPTDPSLAAAAAADDPNAATGFASEYGEYVPPVRAASLEHDQQQPPRLVVLVLVLVLLFFDPLVVG